MPRARRFILVVLGLLAALAVGVVYQMRPPDWWRPIPLDDAMAIELGERFEKGCVTELHRVRDDAGPWAVRIRSDEVNAWLATRMPKWCAHAGVPEIGPVQVRFVESAVEIAVNTPDLPSVAVARIEPELSGGTLRATIRSASLGQLPLTFLVGPSMAAIAELLAGPDGDDPVEVIAAILHGGSMPDEVELTDHRRVRLRDIEIHAGEMLLEFETLPPR